VTGSPGTGKSHVAKAIAYSAVRAGLRVSYAEADDLLGSLAILSPVDKRKRIKPLIDADLLLFDDLFLTRQLPPDSADTLQSILHQRYKLRRSSVITSNRIMDDWHKFLGDAALTPPSSTASYTAAFWLSSVARAIASNKPPTALRSVTNPSNNPTVPVVCPGGI
jgi:DNA replication protein DnaC